MITAFVRRSILAAIIALQSQGCAVTYVHYADNGCESSSQCCASASRGR
jgi:hypothetical protein